MSATGSERAALSPGRAGGRRGGAGRFGFTLVELLVVLVIVGFVLAVVPVSMVKLYDGMQYRSAIGDLLAGLKAARNEAVKSGRSVPFSIDVQARRVEVGGSRTFVLPPSLELGLMVAQQEIQDQRGSIRFYPDGGSTGGSVVVRRSNGDGVRLRVDWLLGSVDQERLD